MEDKEDIAKRDQPVPGGVNGSAFRVNPLNILNRNAKSQRSKLLALALSKPSYYYEFRQVVESGVVDSMINMTYNMFYNLLIDGCDRDGNQIIYKDANDNPQAWKPQLSEATVSKFALKVAEEFESVLEEALDLALPMEYSELATEKMDKLRNVKLQDN